MINTSRCSPPFFWNNRKLGTTFCLVEMYTYFKFGYVNWVLKWNRFTLLRDTRIWRCSSIYISRGRGRGKWWEVEWWWWGLSSSTLPSAVLSACFWVLCASPYVLPFNCSFFIPQHVAHHQVWGHHHHTAVVLNGLWTRTVNFESINFVLYDEISLDFFIKHNME